MKKSNIHPRSLFHAGAARLLHLTSWAGPYVTILQMALLGFVMLSLSRFAMMVWQWDRVRETGIPGEILLQGARADLILLGYFITIPLLLAPLLAHPSRASIWKGFTS